MVKCLKLQRALVSALLLLNVAMTSEAQSLEDAETLSQFRKYFSDSVQRELVSDIQAKYTQFNLKISRAKEKLLSEEQKAWELLHRIDQKLSKPDQLTSFVNNVQGSTSYLSFVDSVRTMLKFAGQFEGAAGVFNNLSVLDKFKTEFEQVERFEAAMRERVSMLKKQLLAHSKIREFQRISNMFKTYAEEIETYKESLDNPVALARKVTQELCQSKVFRNYFAKYSALSSMFLIPTDGEQMPTGSLGELQTNSSLERIIQQKTGASGEALTRQMQTPAPGVEQAIAQLKQMLPKSENNALEAGLPDYKPDDTRGKPLGKRLEYGFNIQGQRANYFPATLDLAFTIGYRLSDKSTVGVGAAYRLGLGQFFKDIEISHQGFGFRTFADLKLKGSVFVAGGYELNQAGMPTVSATPYWSNEWQKSGLVGVSRKFKAGNYVKSQVQFLWDFLSYYQVPRSQPFLFRFGYSLNR